MEFIFDYLHANWMDVLGTTLGLLYLWLEMKENLWMWVVGSIMPIIYIFVLYQAGLYADCGMEVYYFLAGVYGLFYWLRFRKKEGCVKKELRITHVPNSKYLRLISAFLVLWLAMALFLSYCTDSTVPCLDALSTALSIVGLWMLSRKYIEQWWVWLVVDVISMGLYIYKGVYGRALLYGIYTSMVYVGYLTWHRKMQVEE